MYNKYSSFFLNKNIKSCYGVQFSNVAKTPSSIQSLYRGDENITEVIFTSSALITGIFCQSFPEVVAIEQIRLHKLTNLSNDFHMVSMTEEPQVANDWGRGNYITIDPTLFLKYIVDVHSTYHQNQFNFPGRMEREKEHIALVIPFCSIKKITINNTEFVNPFYIKILSDNEEAIQAFQTIYLQLISLLRNKYTQLISEPDERDALQTYVTAYLEFYNQFSAHDNPFKKSLFELSELYPDFMQHFSKANVTPTDSLHDVIHTSSYDIFKKHPYLKKINAAYINRTKGSITCDEDDWAKPAYD